jgi:hypothetical protein
MPFDSATMAWIPDPPNRPKRPRRPGPVVEFEEIRRGTPSTTEDLTEVVASMTVAEVTELAESGMEDLEAIIEAERRGKGRKSILALVKSPSGKVYARYDD